MNLGVIATNIHVGHNVKHGETEKLVRILLIVSFLTVAQGLQKGE